MLTRFTTYVTAYLTLCSEKFSNSAQQSNVPCSRFSRRHALAGFCLFLALFSAQKSWATEPQNPCASQSDDRNRLQCYDQLFAIPSALPKPAPMDGNAPIMPVISTSPSERVESVALKQDLLGDPPERSASLLSRFWEIDPEDKGDTFVVKTYLPNFVLPLHYTSRINRAPYSPTQAASPSPTNMRRTEAKLQISLRAKIADDLLLPGSSLWFAYTQQSLWQVWDQLDSSPFRSTDYQPEAIYILPVPARWGQFADGWRLRLLQLGLAHQSNGQGDPLSRSWNRAYLGASVERGDFSASLRMNYRLREKNNDNNPDLMSYIGRGALSMNWVSGHTISSLTWRTSLNQLHRGSIQLDLTHPVFADNPDGLRWYLQLFSGYGETLLDYNHRQNRIGLGLSLFQF